LCCIRAIVFERVYLIPPKVYYNGAGRFLAIGVSFHDRRRTRAYEGCAG
jgi:hypothetical protein